MSAAARADVLLADSVAVADGRLYVQGGGWSHLFPPALPMLAGRLGIGIVLHLPGTEPVRVGVRLDGPGDEPVRLADGDATRALDGIEASVTPGEMPLGSPLGEHVVPLAINLDGLLLTGAGQYRVAVTIDGVDSGGAAFAVVPG